MNTGTKFYSTFLAASAALMVMHSTAAAQSGSENEVMMSDDPSYCEVYRALSTAPSAECPDQPAVKTRGLSLSGTTGTSTTAAGSVSASTAAVSTTAATAAPQAPRAAAFGSIQFEFNSIELTAPAKNTLDTVASVLKDARLASQSFVIEGHTDSVGSAAYNQSLSEKRAQAVVNYMVSRHGISGNRLSWRGKGESQPFAPDRPDAPVNRRVVILNAAI